MANKTTLLSADDLLAAVISETVTHEIPEIGAVKVRGLEFKEIAKLQREFGEDSDGMICAGVGHALVEPKLSDEQIAALQHAKAGVVMNIWQKISALSAMSNEEILAGEVGGGS